MPPQEDNERDLRHREPDGLKLSMITQPSQVRGGRRESDQGNPPGYSGDAGGFTHGQPNYTDVVEEHGVAGLRIVAKIVDYFAVGIIGMFVIMPIYFVWLFSNLDRFQTVSQGSEPGELPDGFLGDLFLIWGMFFLISITISVLYYFILEYKFRQTAGKKAFGLKVIDVNGGDASPRRLFARAVIYSFALLFYFWIAEVIVMLVRADGRTLTDLVCRTKVIRIKRTYYYPDGWQQQNQ